MNNHLALLLLPLFGASMAMLILNLSFLDPLREAKIPLLSKLSHCERCLSGHFTIWPSLFVLDTHWLVAMGIGIALWVVSYSLYLTVLLLEAKIESCLMSSSSEQIENTTEPSSLEGSLSAFSCDGPEPTPTPSS